MALEDMINVLVDLGVTEILLPFMLVFTIVFATLQKAKVFGDDKKNFNVVVALVMGLAVVVPHVTGAYEANGVADVVDVMNRALPQISVVLVAVVMLLLMIGIWGAEIKWAGGSPAGWVVFVSGVVVFVIFGSSAGWFLAGGIPWLSFLWDEDVKALLVIILVFGIIIWFVTREQPKEMEKVRGVNQWMEGLGRLGGGK